jgi:hypothetical protein
MNPISKNNQYKENSCVFKKCRNKIEITYERNNLRINLCDKHWNILSLKSPEEIKNILGIKYDIKTKSYNYGTGY